MDILSIVSRWLHVIAGIMWIGHLWFFNFVNIPFAAKMKEAGVGKTTVPELMPRALFWFRWGAAWTWLTGVILLLLVFYHGDIIRDARWEGGWTSFALAITFGGVFVYDALYRSPLAANPKVAHTISFIGIALALIVLVYVCHFSFRAYNIHIGAMFGTAMAFNVWFRIWPAQQRIITATKGGEAPDPADLAMAGGRSRHNTYMSVPLIWMMLNHHIAGVRWFTDEQYGWVMLLGMILLGWHITWQFYNRSLKIEGF